MWRSWLRYCDTSRSLGCTNCGTVGWGTAIQAVVWDVQTVAQLVEALRYKPESGVYKVWHSWLRYCDTSRSLGCTNCGTVGWGTLIQAGVWGVQSVAQFVEALRFKPEWCGFDSRLSYWDFSLTYSFLNKMVYSALTQLQYISLLATFFGFNKTTFRPVLPIKKYNHCVHTWWDPHSVYI